MWFRRIRLRRVFILFSVLVVMAVPNGKWCLYQVGALRAMYVWFVGGMFVLGWRKLWEDWRVASPIMLLTFLVCMVMGDVYTNGLSFYKESSWLFDVLSSRRLFLLWVGRLLLGFGGIVSVLRLVYLMKDLLSKVDLVLMIGRNTLGIYPCVCVKILKSAQDVADCCVYSFVRILAYMCLHDDIIEAAKKYGDFSAEI